MIFKTWNLQNMSVEELKNVYRIKQKNLNFWLLFGNFEKYAEVGISWNGLNLSKNCKSEGQKKKTQMSGYYCAY